MRWTNGLDHWGWVSRALHWGMALLILIEVPAGFIMGRTYASPDPFVAVVHCWASNVHHTVGLSLLLLVFVRAIWRLMGPVPTATRTRWQNRAANGTHSVLYALLILVPLSGWAALSSLEATPQFPNHLWFFGMDGFGANGIIPHIVPAVPWDSPTLSRYGTYAAGHRCLLIAGAVLLALHIAAALRHHFLLHDETLLRMIGRQS